MRLRDDSSEIRPHSGLFQVTKLLLSVYPSARSRRLWLRAVQGVCFAF